MGGMGGKDAVVVWRSHGSTGGYQECRIEYLVKANLKCPCSLATSPLCVAGDMTGTRMNYPKGKRLVIR